MGIAMQDNHCHREAKDPIGCIGIETLNTKSVRLSNNTGLNVSIYTIEISSVKYNPTLLDEV